MPFSCTCCCCNNHLPSLSMWFDVLAFFFPLLLCCELWTGISIRARVIILRFQANKSASHFQALSLRPMLSAFPLALFFQGMFISWNCWRTFVSHALSRLPSAIQLGSLKWWVTIWKLRTWWFYQVGSWRTSSIATFHSFTPFTPLSIPCTFLHSLSFSGMLLRWLWRSLS